jgi:hypothetical protein
MRQKIRSLRRSPHLLGLTALTLVLSVLPNSAFSTQKITAGGACTKINSKVVSNNKQYTCIKKGNKLVWNNGTAIKSAAPVMKPTPMPTPSASETAAPKPSASPTPTYGYSNSISNNQVSRGVVKLHQNWRKDHGN